MAEVSPPVHCHEDARRLLLLSIQQERIYIVLVNTHRLNLLTLRLQSPSGEALSHDSITSLQPSAQV